MDAGYNITNFKGQSVTTSASPNGSATSNFTFLVSDDLGGGLKSEARWEIDPDLMQTGGRTSGTTAAGTTSNVTSFLGNGYSFLGLSGGFGRVEFGTLNYSTLSANGEGNSNFGTAIGSGYRVTSFDAVRAQNAISYQTPVMGGFSAKILMSAKNDQQTNGTASAANVNQIYGRDGVSELSALYANGPLKVRANLLSMSQDSAVLNAASGAAVTLLTRSGKNFKLNTYSASYQATPTVSVAAFYQTAKSDPIALAYTVAGATGTQTYDRKTMGLSTAINVTPALTAMFNYQRVQLASTDGITVGSAFAANTLGTAIVGPVGGQSTTVTGLGVDYALSKKTTMYWRYENDNDKAIVRAITGYATNTAGTYTANAVGMRVAF